jgi:nitrite reductase/ring-hydroxylating ferredoxin subunit
VSDLPDERPFQPAAIGARALARTRLRSGGLSRRTLLRRSLGGAAALWLATFAGSLLHGIWPTGAKATGKVRVGTLDDLVRSNPGLPIRDGFPAYVPAAKAFVMLIDPAQQGFVTGRDATGDGIALNVRALSQVCPHLGCRPNPCIDDFWMHCPCHQSRYDRLGIKAEGRLFGPAPRSMDRFAVEVDDFGGLTIDTSQLTRGPQPVRLGEPGLEPPRAASGCT